MLIKVEQVSNRRNPVYEVRSSRMDVLTRSAIGAISRECKISFEAMCLSYQWCNNLFVFVFDFLLSW